MAAGFFLVSAACCVLFLCVAYVVINPEKGDMPGDGECEDCVRGGVPSGASARVEGRSNYPQEEDRNCKRWVKAVEDKHAITAICPHSAGLPIRSETSPLASVTSASAGF